MKIIHRRAVYMSSLAILLITVFWPHYWIRRTVGAGDAFVVSGHGQQFIFVEPKIEGTSGVVRVIFGGVLGLKPISTLQQDTDCFILDKKRWVTTSIPDFAGIPFIFNNQVFLASAVRLGGETYEHSVSGVSWKMAYYRLDGTKWNPLDPNEFGMIDSAYKENHVEELRDISGNSPEEYGWKVTNLDSGAGQTIANSDIHAVIVEPFTLHGQAYEVRRIDNITSHCVATRFDVREYPGNEPHRIIYDENADGNDVSRATYSKFLYGQ